MFERALVFSALVVLISFAWAVNFYHQRLEEGNSRNLINLVNNTAASETGQTSRPVV